MDQNRLEQSSQELQAKLEELLGTDHVYYNPPASVHMEYDAIVYSRSDIRNTFANNAVYGQKNRYQVTTITRDPDAKIIGDISRLPMCSFDRSYVADNLYHNVFTLYF